MEDELENQVITATTNQHRHQPAGEHVDPAESSADRPRSHATAAASSTRQRIGDEFYADDSSSSSPVSSTTVGNDDAVTSDNNEVVVGKVCQEEQAELVAPAVAEDQDKVPRDSLTAKAEVETDKVVSSVVPVSLKREDSNTVSKPAQTVAVLIKDDRAAPAATEEKQEHSSQSTNIGKQPNLKDEPRRESFEDLLDQELGELELEVKQQQEQEQQQTRQLDDKQPADSKPDKPDNQVEVHQAPPPPHPAVVVTSQQQPPLRYTHLQTPEFPSDHQQQQLQPQVVVDLQPQPVVGGLASLDSKKFVVFDTSEHTATNGDGRQEFNNSGICSGLVVATTSSGLHLPPVPQGPEVAVATLGTMNDIYFKVSVKSLRRTRKDEL